MGSTSLPLSPDWPACTLNDWVWWKWCSASPEPILWKNWQLHLSSSWSSQAPQKKSRLLCWGQRPWRRALRQWHGSGKATWDVLPSPACRWFQPHLSTDYNPMRDNKQESSSLVRWTPTIMRDNYKLFLKPLNLRVVCYTAIDKQNNAYYGEREDNSKGRPKKMKIQANLA